MANNIYILSIQPNTTVNDQLIITKLNSAVDWIQIFPYTFVFVSSRNAKEWADILKSAITPALYFISELDISNKGGWLPKWVWDRLRKAKEQHLQQRPMW